jgi:hypothetical protein
MESLLQIQDVLSQIRAFFSSLIPDTDPNFNSRSRVLNKKRGTRLNTSFSCFLQFPEASFSNFKRYRYQNKREKDSEENKG